MNVVQFFEDTMSTKREELKERLLDAAEARIQRDGLRALRARDVTADAGCALGGLYTAFQDLDMLILAVNSRTLLRLGEQLRTTAEGKASPAARLEALAEAYLDFALENLTLWSAAFEHRMPADWEVPDWHIAEHAVLIEEIRAPLSELQPHLGPEALALRARTLFSAVHGVVKLSLEDRFVAVHPSGLKNEIAALVRLLTTGMAAAR
jgi:AcrR family transcriptional regulator